MKKLTKIFFALTALTLSLASCNQMPMAAESSFSDNEIRFGDAGIRVETKAFTEATNTTLQSNGFNVAAIIDGVTPVTMFNKAVTYSNGAYSVAGEHYYFPASGTMSFYGVYPKTQAVTVTSGAATLAYSHNTDTDLIAAKVTGVANQSTAVMMAFDHILSQISIKAQGAETTVDYKVFSVKITDANGGTYTYADGTWTPNLTTQAYTVYNNASGMTISTSAMTAVGSAMSFMPGDAKLNVVWKCYNKGSETVVCEKDVTVDVNLPQGNHSTLNLTLPFDSSNLTFDSSIEEWIIDAQNIEMKEPIIVETWVFKQASEILNLTGESISDSIKFISNNQSFDKIHISQSSLPSGNMPAYIAYYKNNNPTRVVNTSPMTMGQWTLEAYRTIAFEENPTGDLLEFLQANAIKQ